MTLAVFVASIRGVHHVVLMIALLSTGLLGCGSTSQCPRVGESCTFSCCVADGLSCRAGASGGYCTKSCQCHGTSICTPSDFSEGCPQGSVCVTTDSDGTGQCAVLCDRPPCSPGSYICGSSSDGGSVVCGATPAPLTDMAGGAD